jgi:hypothetical protein
MKRLRFILPPVALAALILAPSPTLVRAGVIYASGQLLIENDPGTHDDVRENRIFRIDTTTGVATPVSPLFDGSTPPALAGTRSGELLGIRSGRLGSVDVEAGGFNPFGDPIGATATAFDVMSDGRGFLLPFNADFDTQQLFSIDLMTALIAPVGSPTAIGDAIDVAAGHAPGTAEPFLIGLGSVGDRLFGVDLDTESLIVIDPDTGVAGVAGALGAVGGSNGGGFSGFAAMTGVDEDRDGVFDTLYGAVNFGPDGGRLGGLARFDLSAGTWDLIGSNPGVIFFGFGASVVPEPSSVVLLTAGFTGLVYFSRRKAGR